MTHVGRRGTDLAAAAAGVAAAATAAAAAAATAAVSASAHVRDLDARQRLRATLSTHFLEHARAEKARQPTAFGLDVSELADAPPADVSLWVTEAGGSGDQLMLSTGQAAMKELLEPRKPGNPGARVVIGKVKEEGRALGGAPLR